MKTTLFSIALLILGCTANAQMITTPNFTLTSGENGVIIVSQSSGTITFCTDWAWGVGSGTYSGATAQGECASIGKVTPPASNWVVTIQPAASVTAPHSIYLVNYSTNQIVQCAAVAGANGAAVGSCKIMPSTVPK